MTYSIIKKKESILQPISLPTVILQYSHTIHSVVKAMLYEVRDYYYRELLLTRARTLYEV